MDAQENNNNNKVLTTLAVKTYTLRNTSQGLRLGLILRTEAGGGLLSMWKRTFKFHKMWGLSCLAKELLASQERLCSMELASITLPDRSDVSLAVTTPCQLQPCRVLCCWASKLSYPCYIVSVHTESATKPKQNGRTNTVTATNHVFLRISCCHPNLLKWQQLQENKPL
jgi:hypothetical protein